MFPKHGTTSLSSEHDTAVSSGEAQKSAIQDAICHTIITNKTNPHNYSPSEQGKRREHYSRISEQTSKVN
jgi:hypothetical protein